jgi:DNA transformation protein
MKKLICLRIHQFRACLSPLGKISCRPLFGGYSLAIDNTVFAMMAEGKSIFGFASRARSTAWRIKTRC